MAHGCCVSGSLVRASFQSQILIHVTAGCDDDGTSLLLLIAFVRRGSSVRIGDAVVVVFASLHSCCCVRPVYRATPARVVSLAGDGLFITLCPQKRRINLRHRHAPREPPCCYQPGLTSVGHSGWVTRNWGRDTAAGALAVWAPEQWSVCLPLSGHCLFSTTSQGVTKAARAKMRPWPIHPV